MLLFERWLLAPGLVALAVVAFCYPRYVTQVFCLLIGNIGAHAAFFVSISLGRITPFAAAVVQPRTKNNVTGYFLPFVVYCAASTLCFAMFWEIPEGLPAAYGKYRFAIQLTTLLSVALAARGLARALIHEGASVLLFDILAAGAILHGGASLYGLLARRMGWPMIAHFAPFGTESHVAAFQYAGTEIYRPGGLAGEPKTAACIFGVYLLAWIFAPLPDARPRWRKLRIVAAGLSAIGFVSAFSTSGFVAIAAAAAVLLFRYPRRLARAGWVLGPLWLLCVILWSVSLYEGQELGEVLWERSLDRVERSADQDGMDPPVAASFRIVAHDPQTAMLGTGLGGSSFRIMRYLGWYWETAYAANIGFVFLLTETGAVGLLLLLIPSGLLFLIREPPPGHPNHAPCQLFLTAGVAAFAFQLAGSGVPMGYPLAVGALCAHGHLALAARTSSAP